MAKHDTKSFVIEVVANPSWHTAPDFAACRPEYEGRSPSPICNSALVAMSLSANAAAVNGNGRKRRRSSTTHSGAFSSEHDNIALVQSRIVAEPTKTEKLVVRNPQEVQ